MRLGLRMWEGSKSVKDAKSNRSLYIHMYMYVCVYRFVYI